MPRRLQVSTSAHYCCCCLSAFFGTCENNQFRRLSTMKLNAAFTGVVAASFDKRVFEVNHQGQASDSECKEDCLSRFPPGNSVNFISSSHSLNSESLGFASLWRRSFRSPSESVSGDSFNVKETLNETHGKFCRFWVN